MGKRSADQEGFASLVRAHRDLWHGDGRRMLLVKGILCAAFLVGMAVAPGVWRNERGFPTMPLYPWLPELPSALCLALSGALALIVLTVAILPTPGRIALVPPAILAVLALFDVSRMQPWAFQYALIFLALGSMRDDDTDRSRAMWRVCGAIVACLYFWSGIQKANAAFAGEVFPWLLQPLGADLVARLRPFWIVAPVFEASIGLLLLIPRTRRWGLGMALAMHAFILLALGPFGQNYDAIAWPWNVAMGAFAFALFGRNGAPLFAAAWSRPFGRAILVLVGVLPALNFVDRWDGFLAGSYYSGKLRDGWIYLTAEGVRHLPRGYVEGNAGLVQESPNRFRLDILLWSSSGMNAPPYGEPRFYPGLVRHLERAGVPRDEMILMVQDRVSLADGKRTYSVVPVR